MKLINSFLITVFLLAGLVPAIGQDYDVLPLTGRNELFHSYLLEEFDSVIAKRKIAVETALTSKENILARQQELRDKYLKLLGDLPDSTPLNAVVVDTIETSYGYHIEKLHYQSVPNHHVTANFYIPETGSAPYPAVVVLCGHYPVAKTYADYQNLCILFAKNGIAALIIDPICQGERYQITNATGTLSFLGQSGTAAHSRLDVGAVLDGTSVVAYELWDSHRAVDYLYTLTDLVDTSRIGCIGHSGGGAQATFLLAFDTRLKVGTVANYLCNKAYMFKIEGPQTASQNLSYEGENGIDEPDYIAMFAPKPFMLIGTHGDALFSVDSMRSTVNELKPLYDTLDTSDKVMLFETSDVHDLTKVKREAAVRWFKHWFMNNNDTVVEADQVTLKQDTLVVTSTGQVMTEFDNELNVTELNVNLADSLVDDRSAFWSENTKEECLNQIKELIRYDSLNASPVYEASDNIPRTNYHIEKGKITYMNDVPVTSLTFIPENNTSKLPALLYVDGRGKKTDAGENGIIEQVYIDSGYVVMAIDVRGFGETADNPSKNESKHNNLEHRNGVISLYLGKTLPGQRVEDIEKAMSILLARTDVDTSNVTLVGIDRASVAVLHAAALDKRFKKVIIRKSEENIWLNAIADPTIPNQMTQEIPSAMKYYDIADLIDKGITPREVVFAEEPVLRPSTVSELKINQDKFQNYPNPFSETSVINYSLTGVSDVTLEIISSEGKEIKSVKHSSLAPGNYQIVLQAREFNPGIYIYKLNIDKTTVAVHKMIVTK